MSEQRKGQDGEPAGSQNGPDDLDPDPRALTWRERRLADRDSDYADYPERLRETRQG